MNYSGLIYVATNSAYNPSASTTIPVVAGEIVYATCGYNNEHGTLDTWRFNPNAATTLTTRRPLIYGGANKLLNTEFYFEGLEGSCSYKNAVAATADFKVLVTMMGAILVLAYDKPAYATQDWAMNTSAVATSAPSIWIGQIGVLSYIENDGQKCSFKLSPLVDLTKD